MKETITIKAEVRAEKGTSPVGRLRRQGWLPGVVYSDGKPAETIRINGHDFRALLRHHRGEHMIMDLVVGGGEPRKVLLKEIQHHPVKGWPIHADFHAISMTRKLRVEVPVRLTGDPIGVTQQGGILDHLLRSVEVECLPTDLMEEIVVDVSHLALGKHLSVKDIALDAGRYRLVTAPDVAIAAVSAPKAEEVAAPVEGEAAAAAEPEVITGKKEEGEEGAEAAPAGKEKSAGGKEAAGEKGAKEAGGKEKPAGKAEKK